MEERDREKEQRRKGRHNLGKIRRKSENGKGRE